MFCGVRAPTNVHKKARHPFKWAEVADLIDDPVTPCPLTSITSDGVE